MVISNDTEFGKLKDIGRICALTLQKMAASMEAGMTTAELDQIGRKLLENAARNPLPNPATVFPARPASASTKKWRTAFLARASSSPAISST